MDFIKAATDAWNRTHFLLFQQGSRQRWVNFWLLSLLLGSGGGGSPGGEFKPDSMPQIDPAAMLGMFAVVGLACFFGAILFGWLGSLARMVLVENLIYNRHAVREPLGRLRGLGTSLFLFTLALTLMGLLAVGGAFGAVFMALMPAQTDDPAQYLGPVLCGGLVAFPVLLVLLTALQINEELIVAIMYRENVGALAGWRLWLGMFSRAPFSWIVYFCFRTVVGVMVAMAVGVFVALCGGVLAVVLGSVLAMLIVIPVGALFSVPMVVYLRCFSLYCLQGLQPGMAMLPPGGQGTLEDKPEVAEVPGGPGFSPTPDFE